MPVRGVRRRYLYAKAMSDDMFTEEQFMKALVDKVHLLYGVTGSAEMNLRLIEWNDDDQAAIVRVNHTMLTEMKAALAHISDINDSKARFDVLRVSGTIKTLKSKL